MMELQSLLGKLLTLFVIIGLTGCATKQVETFIPYTPVIRELSVFQEDLNTCRLYALNYLKTKGNLDVSQIAQEGAREGSSKLGYWALSPLAPALGALGGASSEVLTQLGLDSKEAKKIVAICLHDKGLRHNLYEVYDPSP